MVAQAMRDLSLEIMCLRVNDQGMPSHDLMTTLYFSPRVPIKLVCFIN